MGLSIRVSPNFYEEKEYILSVLFEDFLGIPIWIEKTDSSGFIVSDGQKRTIYLADHFFAHSENVWLQPETLPRMPLKSWNVGAVLPEAKTVYPTIPVLYGNDPADPGFFRKEPGAIRLELDIFGSCFFMLTRYEEAVKPDRDAHDRFPAKASLAHQEGFLDRPIVNEYLEILWACLKYVWPELLRRPRQFKTCVSHDVDNPFEHVFCSPFALGKRCVGDVFKRRNVFRAFDRISGWIKVKSGNANADPLNVFDWMMDLSEKNNLKSTFNFITDHTAAQDKDGLYRMDHPLIRDLLRKMHDRGHEIGLHASYNTYRDSSQTKKEYQCLRRVCEQEKVTQKAWGSRQHYLRCEIPTTFQNLNDAGLDYDMTLSFADEAGFRCGVCYEFQTFNVRTRQMLRLRERPLVVMECTVIDKGYMNLGLEGGRAYRLVSKLKQRCRLFNGDFTILWHNSRLIEKNEQSLYQQILSA